MCYLSIVENFFDHERLSVFCQSVSQWPATTTELEAVADQLATLLGAPFVAIQRPGQGGAGGRSGFRFKHAGTSAAATSAIDEFVRRTVSQASSIFADAMRGIPQIRELPLPVIYPWRSESEVRNLYMVCVCGESRASRIEARADSARRDHGWVIVGSSQALDPRESALLLAAALRLAALAEEEACDAAIQLRGQFLSIASHELKTPLTSIYGILQLQQRMLRMKKDEPIAAQQERQESYLKMVIRQVKRLNELIDGLLDVSRIQNGRFMVEPTDTDVAAIVRETISSRLTVIAQEAGVKMNVETPPTLPAFVDPVRMEEVVTNLTMNAIRFSPEGGMVWVRLRDDHGLLRLAVRDQGPSVPLEDRERIFQPFERAQRTSRFGGLGLGLFISRQIALLHGGNVGLVESLPGKGNVFEASFPLRASTVASA